MSALLSLERVSKRFGFRSILENICFSLDAGEFVMLIGNNGAGKTTLLHIVSSLMKPTRGTISFRGRNRKEHLREWLQTIGNLSAPVKKKDKKIKKKKKKKKKKNRNVY